eukprot:241374-Prymnesium_polylepis.1
MHMRWRLASSTMLHVNPNTSEWTGDECAHCLCTKKSVPRTGSFGNELPSLSGTLYSGSAQRSIPNGTARIAHVADDVTSSQTSGHLAKYRTISRYGCRTHVTS